MLQECLLLCCTLKIDNLHFMLKTELTYIWYGYFEQLEEWKSPQQTLKNEAKAYF